MAKDRKGRPKGQRVDPRLSKDWTRPRIGGGGASNEDVRRFMDRYERPSPEKLDDQQEQPEPPKDEPMP